MVSDEATSLDASCFDELEEIHLPVNLEPLHLRVHANEASSPPYSIAEKEKQKLKRLYVSNGGTFLQ